MAVSVDATLAARLDSQIRVPKISIVSSEFQSAIPFEGNSYEISQTATLRPNQITLSTGALALTYINDNGDPVYMYTDTDKTYWTTVDISGVLGGNTNDLSSISLTEMVNGNIGLAWADSGGDVYIGVITSTGTVVTSRTLIESHNTTDDVFVTRLSNDTYIMAYTYDYVNAILSIKTCSNADFTGWSAETDLSLSPLTTADRDASNPSLMETSDGDLFLFFDIVTEVSGDDEIRNIYSMMSTDNGATWSAPEARTTNDELGANSIDPVAVQSSNGTVYFVYVDNSSVLHMNQNTNGLVSDVANTMGLKHLHFDSSRNRLIVVHGSRYAVGGVAVIDPDTWTIEQNYTSLTTPALNDIFYQENVRGQRNMIAGDGRYVAFKTTSNELDVICVVDWVSDTVTNYVIRDTSVTQFGAGPDGEEPYSIPAYGLNANVFANFGGYNSGNAVYSPTVWNIDIHESLNRMYLSLAATYYLVSQVRYGYIDLTESYDPVDGYSYHSLTTAAPTASNYNRMHHETLNMILTTYPECGDMVYIPEYDWIAFCVAAGGYTGGSGYAGAILVFDCANSMAVVKDYNQSANSQAPYYGGKTIKYYNNRLYVSFDYRSAAPHTDQRGLLEINLLTDNFTYHRPTYATQDEYNFYDMVVDETNGVMYLSGYDGVSKFDLNAYTWELFDNETLPGWTSDGDDRCIMIDRDPVTGNLFTGSGDTMSDEIWVFNEVGSFDQLKYITATKAVTYSWGNEVIMSSGQVESQPAVSIDSDDSLWVSWNHKNTVNGDNVLYWDTERGGVELVNDVRGDVTLSWKMKEENTCEFSLARGNYYDSQNSLSILGTVVQKGRKITVQIGEIIDGVDYMLDQGVYIVDSAHLDYRRGQHPVVNVVARGRTSIWKEKKIPVTQLYAGAEPDYILESLITTNTELESADYEIPDTIIGSHEVTTQWIDKSLYEIFEELLDHFFYILSEKADGVITIKQLDLDKAVDQTYSDLTKIVKFTPDDSYSSYVNRITVKSETDDYTELTYAEERIQMLSGTCGWWSKKKEKTVYYSDDKQRECRDPRLVVIDSIKEYGLLLDQLSTGDGGETISYEDPNRQFVIIEIDVPDLTAALIGAVLAFALLGAAATVCVLSCGVFIAGVAAAAAVVFWILAAIATYSYEIWARPLGRVKTTIQYQDDDLEFQRKLNGEVVEEQIDDYLCYTVAECQRVAEGEMELVKAQRKRVKLDKIYDLRNEVGDKISVVHPFSGVSMNIFITGINRVYDKGDGVIDTLEGWRITS